MKRGVILKKVVVVFFTVFLVMGTGNAFAWGPDSSRGAGMRGNCMAGGQPGNQMKMMMAKLKLNDEQRVLMDEMHQAVTAFRQKKCPDGWKPGCMKDRQQMRAMHLFRAELGAENPDFQAVADKLKSEYAGDYTQEFDAVVDARAAFMSSLSPEQRDNLMQMKFHGRGPCAHAGKGGSMK